MKMIVNLITVLSVLTFVSCNNDEPKNEESQPNSKVNTQLVEQGNSFAMKFFATANSQSPEEENIVLSPLSLNMALAMVWNGANGQTKDAILTAMGMSNFTPEEVNGHFRTIRQQLETADPNTQLALANSIWHDIRFEVKPPFINLNTTYYDAMVQGLDFRNPASVDIINQWCSNKTNGLITDMIESIKSDVVMYLINALYFKGLWADSCGFDTAGTRFRTFTKENNESINVEMMSQTNKLKFYNDNTLSMVTIPYGNKSFSMTFILPAYNTTFSAMLNELKQGNYWQSCINNRVKQTVEVFVPRFKVEYDSKETLNDILSSLGMGVAFTRFADFSGISNMPTLISSVLQKTYIDVNERGTEAAAVTVVEMVVTSVPDNTVFNANRPFLFVIQEESTGAVLFMGKIGNPTYN